MKKTHIFHGNQYIESFNCTGERPPKRRLAIMDRIKLFLAETREKLNDYGTRIEHASKASIIALAVISSIGWGFVAGTYVAPAKTVIANKEVIKEVKGKTAVMERIAKCESGNSHLDPKTGQVYMLANTNKTVDVGKYMINSIHHKKAKELGYDVTKEVDNEKMAYWMYETMGTEPWVYSKHCWNK